MRSSASMRAWKRDVFPSSATGAGGSTALRPWAYIPCPPSGYLCDPYMSQNKFWSRNLVTYCGASSPANLLVTRFRSHQCDRHHGNQVQHRAGGMGVLPLRPQGGPIVCEHGPVSRAAINGIGEAP